MNTGKPGGMPAPEVKEETGYTLTSWEYRGIVTFVYGKDTVEYMSLYTADGFEEHRSNATRASLNGWKRRGFLLWSCGREIKSSSGFWMRKRVLLAEACLQHRRYSSVCGAGRKDDGAFRRVNPDGAERSCKRERRGSRGRGASRDRAYVDRKAEREERV